MVDPELYVRFGDEYSARYRKRIKRIDGELTETKNQTTVEWRRYLPSFLHFCKEVRDGALIGDLHRRTKSSVGCEKVRKGAAERYFLQLESPTRDPTWSLSWMLPPESDSRTGKDRTDIERDSSWGCHYRPVRRL